MTHNSQRLHTPYTCIDTHTRTHTHTHTRNCQGLTSIYMLRCIKKFGRFEKLLERVYNRIFIDIFAEVCKHFMKTNTNDNDNDNNTNDNNTNDNNTNNANINANMHPNLMTNHNSIQQQQQQQQQHIITETIDENREIEMTNNNYQNKKKQGNETNNNKIGYKKKENYDKIFLTLMARCYFLRLQCFELQTQKNEKNEKNMTIYEICNWNIINQCVSIPENMREKENSNDSNNNKNKNENENKKEHKEGMLSQNNEKTLKLSKMNTNEITHTLINIKVFLKVLFEMTHILQ